LERLKFESESLVLELQPSYAFIVPVKDRWLGLNEILWRVKKQELLILVYLI